MSFINPSVITENMLTENYAWVDNLLREKYYKYALTIENYDEFYSAGILPKNYDFDFEEIENPVCKRFEDKIFDYKDNSNRLGCQSPIPSNEYKYVRQNKNKVEDDCISVVSELTDDEDNYEFVILETENDIYGKKIEEDTYSSDEDEIKIWPTKNEKENTYEDYYKKLYEEEYEEYYKDDNSELGYYGSVY
jgi:hypothetical protein